MSWPMTWSSALEPPELLELLSSPPQAPRASGMVRLATASSALTRFMAGTISRVLVTPGGAVRDKGVAVDHGRYRSNVPEAQGEQFGPNSWLVEEMYEDYLADPASVSE